MLAVRILVFVAFIAIMSVVKFGIHAVVDLGVVPWLLLMAGAFWIGIRIENAQRAKDGRPPYSWREARELVMPAAAFGAILLIAFAMR